MMNTMSGIEKFLGAGILRMVMESEPVHQVFKKRPEKHAAEIKAQRSIPCCMQEKNTVRHHGADDRHVNAKDRLRAGFCKNLELFGLEDCCLSFIFNFYFHLTERN